MKLPPHTNESYPVTHHGEVSKPFIIAAISIAAIIVLIVLLFVGKQFVGKAFYEGVENTAGFETISSVVPDTSFAATVRARTAGDTVGVSFSLALPAGITCSAVSSSLGWDESDTVTSRAECTGSTVEFEYSTIDWTEAKSGEFDVALISFNGVAAPGTYNLDFTSFDIISLDDETNDFISGDGIDAQIIIAEIAVAACTVRDLAACASEDECGAATGIWLPARGGRRESQCVQCVDDTTCSEDKICQDNACALPPVCSLTLLSACADEDECQSIGAKWITDAEGKSTCAPSDVCGNNILESTEECDDGNTDGDNLCTAACRFTSCSDGVVQSPNWAGQMELCDDGNKMNGDGCSYDPVAAGEPLACTVELGFSCLGEPSVCTPTCTSDAQCNAGEICQEAVCIADDDSDGVPNQNDACPGFDDRADADGDDIADGCDDDDNDGPQGDLDDDTIPNSADNCPAIANPGQQDADNDGTGDACETALFFCTGSSPTNAQLCTDDATGLSANTARTVVTSCGAAKCEYTCSAGFILQNGACIAAQPAGGVYSTRITATANIPLATVYTILRDSQGIILVFKSERMENINRGQSYLATATYPFPGRVVTKEVYVQDRLPHQRWTIHGRLQENVGMPQIQAVQGVGLTLVTQRELVAQP